MMIDSEMLPLFLIATLALNLTPGPDMLYVIARSVGQGRAAGIASSLGIAAGCLAHALAVSFGLAPLLIAAPQALRVIQHLGAAYLLYLGLRLILTSRPAADANPERDRIWAIFRQGVVTNLLNPKIALFFSAFLPQFVDPARGQVAVQMLLLGTAFNISGTSVNVLVALASHRAGSAFARRFDASALYRRIAGGLLIALGLKLAVQR